MDGLFTITELRRHVATVLRRFGYTPSASGRVRAVPDTRTIRYYTTLGLIDRPAEMRGRTALYTSKHVMQLVAIKRLQSSDLALAEIQQRLFGRTEKQLKPLAGLPDDFGLEDFVHVAESSSAHEKKDEDQKSDVDDVDREFWTELPSSQVSAPEPTSLDPIPVVCQRIMLHPGVEILIALSSVEGTNASVEDQRIRKSAEPLIRELKRLGVIPD